MTSRQQRLGWTVKTHREHIGITQENVAENCGAKTSRTAVAHLEQGRSIPKPEVLSAICMFLDIPNAHWEPFTQQDSLWRFKFEEKLSEFVGRSVNLDTHNQAAQVTAEHLISTLFTSKPSAEQLLDTFNSILVYYGVGPISASFFHRYFDLSAFASLDAFSKAIEKYQMDAIRLFATFAEAFEVLNSAKDVEDVLQPIQPYSTNVYDARTEWKLEEPIEDEVLPDLGYISAQQVRQEANERGWLIDQLRSLAQSIRSEGRTAIQKLSSKKGRKIDSLLRKFESTIIHGVSSPLFQPDPDALDREADRLAPKSEEELGSMERTQQKALRNLSRYLSADHMDVYVATSMRTAADYVSVNHFVTALFDHDLIKGLKLRYFNPTQSWVDDRVAKGLVEALMLKRASVTIYMAQKSDTFGKDSEASVALGQGKPVIVYVPKFEVGGVIDSEDLYRLERDELAEKLPNEDDADDTVDKEALVAGLLRANLEGQDDESLRDCVRRYWADFDLYTEAERFDAKTRERYRAWLDRVIRHNEEPAVPDELRASLIGALIATAINFEKRAELFREIHPLALQVILSSGVLNGILVARTGEQCAKVLAAVIKNELKLKVEKDANNYRLVEQETGSTIRVISRYELLRNSFEAHYRGARSSDDVV